MNLRNDLKFGCEESCVYKRDLRRTMNGTTQSLANLLCFKRHGLRNRALANDLALWGSCSEDLTIERFLYRICAIEYDGWRMVCIINAFGCIHHLPHRVATTSKSQAYILTLRYNSSTCFGYAQFSVKALRKCLAYMLL